MEAKAHKFFAFPGIQTCNFALALLCNILITDVSLKLKLIIYILYSDRLVIRVWPIVYSPWQTSDLY